jgi:hypothetical protein
METRVSIRTGEKSTQTGDGFMLIIRDVFTAKPGQASNLAKLFKKTFSRNGKVRIMTDMVSAYNTVIMEFEVKNLAEFEDHMKNYRSGKPDPMVDESAMKEFSKYQDMYQSGHREVLQIVD